MIIDARSVSIAVCCAVLLSGCTLLAPVKTNTEKYTLNDIPPDLAGERAHSSTLLVLVPEAEPLYASTQMAYTTQAYQIAYFSENEWAETPPQMIQPLLIETLRRTHYFGDVLSSPDFGRHTFMLRSEILEIKQDFTSEPAMLRLTMRFDLSREATNQVIASKELSVRQPMSERNPKAGVVAANQAMVKLLSELADFVIDHAD
jgi:cholesterol transport system auxiliary component